MDNCLGKLISGEFSATLSVPKKLQPGMVEANVPGFGLATLNLFGKLLDYQSSIFVGNGNVLAVL